MKILSFLFLCLMSSFAYADLDEFVIATEDKSCAIHYLTTRTKYNWTIKVDKASCQDGWVHGNTTVQLYSPTKQLMESLSGSFQEGYWLGDFPLVKQIIERTSPEDHIQSLSFLLGEDKEANITYVGQLRATKPQDRLYGPFTGCPDFRVLVVVSDEKNFQNEAFQDKIAEQGLKYAASYCPNLEIVALFGAKSDHSPKIIFQMQVDPKTKERQVIPVSDGKTNPIQRPMELRTEKTDVLVSVDPSEEHPIVSYTLQKKPSQPKQEILSEPPETVLGHLRILSKTFGKPVSGRVVVHINRVLLDGTGVTDLPEEIQLKYYPNLKTGWAVVGGDFDKGQLRVQSVQFCEKEWCQDVP